MTRAPSSATQNPLFAAWTGSFELPPFARIKPGHFRPAFDRALAAHRAEIDAIAADAAAPGFDNTIGALEKSGRELERVANVFFVLAGADTSDEIEAIERDISPLLARHSNALYLNRALYARIADLYKRRDTLGLNAEQARVLERYHTRFVRAGAALEKSAQERLAAINERLASLGTQFGQNVLADEKSFAMMLEESDLAGLPDFARAAARAAAEERGQPGKYAITLARSSVETFLQFSSRRDLREKIFQAWIRRGENGGTTDNRALIAEMVALRGGARRSCSASRVLPTTGSMIRWPRLRRRRAGCSTKSGAGHAQRPPPNATPCSALVAEEGGNFALAPHDWRYYAEKLRKAKFDFDEAEIKPYFQLDKMIEAAFETARRLFGLTFTPVAVPLYHPDARAWEVTDEQGRHIALFIGDYFARSSKHSGAWMTSLRDQEKLSGDIRPIVLNVCNFSKPAAGEPALLVVRRRAHAVPRIRPRAARNVVERDLSVARRHRGAERFRRTALATLRALAGSAGDPAAIRAPRAYRPADAEGAARPAAGDAHLQSGLRHSGIHRLRAGRSRPAFAAGCDGARRRRSSRRKDLERIAMPAEIVMRHRLPHFQHLFSGGGYAAGYYSYMWSEVLDADAFAAFEETGDAFDPATAKRLRDYIYSAGNLRDPAKPTKPSAAGCRRSTRC